MGDVFAIVSKAVFEKEARVGGSVVGLGGVWPIARYTGTGKVFESALAGGGRIFMVTVRPPDEQLWLLAILESPKFDAKSKAWVAAPNAVKVVDITALRKTVKFESGKGMSQDKGTLGMSLQTPRALGPGDAEPDPRADRRRYREQRQERGEHDGYRERQEEHPLSGPRGRTALRDPRRTRRRGQSPGACRFVRGQRRRRPRQLHPRPGRARRASALGFGACPRWSSTSARPGATKRRGVPSSPRSRASATATSSAASSRGWPSTTRRSSPSTSKRRWPRARSPA